MNNADKHKLTNLNNYRPLKPQTVLEIMRGRNQIVRAEEYARFTTMREGMYKKYKDVLIAIDADYFVDDPEKWIIDVRAYSRSELIINTKEPWAGFPSPVLLVQLELLHG